MLFCLRNLIITFLYHLSSPKISQHIFLGNFTVREALHIMLYRYTGKNSAKAARKVGDHVFYEGALGMGGFGLGGWGS